jgi:tetratricopeptide (TPR) repeat protein
MIPLPPAQPVHYQARRTAINLLGASFALTVLVFALWSVHVVLPLLCGLAAAAGSLLESGLEIARGLARSPRTDAAIYRPALRYSARAALAAPLGLAVAFVLPLILKNGDAIDVILPLVAYLIGFASVRFTGDLVDGLIAAPAVANPPASRPMPEVKDRAPSEHLLSRETFLRDLYERTSDERVAKEFIEVLKQLRKFDDAANIYDALISASPDDDKLLLDKAALYREIGDERRYVEVAQQAERIAEKRSFEENIGKEITLREVELRDLAFFGNFKWELQPTVNVLLGRNGYGKSHLLRAMVAMLQADREITADYCRNGGRSPMLRATIRKDEATETSLRSRLVFDQSFGKVPVLAIPDMRYVDKSQDSIGPPRSVSDLRSGGARQFLRNESFEGTILTFLYELSLEYVKSGQRFDTPVFQLMQKTVKSLTDSAFAFADVISRDSARFEILVTTEGNESNPLPIQKASQGTLSVLSMVGLIYRFLRALHPHVPETDLTRQQAIVVIDEIDAHLHPTWQQKILQLFRDTFPRVQFIVTAHTPLVVAGCKEREVAVLVREGMNDMFAVKVMPEHFIGATVADMYRQVFEVEDKDLTYLRLNTLRSSKGELQQRYKELSERKGRTEKWSPDQETTLADVREKLHYLHQVEIVQAKRQKAENAESQREMLELESMSLRGEVTKLKNTLESRPPPDDAEQLSGLVNFLRELIEADPKQSGVIEPYIRYLSRQGQHEHAARLLEGLLERQPDNVDYLKGLTVQYQEMRNYSQASAVLRRAQKLAPHDDGLRLMQTSLQQVQGEEVKR